MKTVLITVFSTILFFFGCQKKEQPGFDNSTFENEKASTDSDTGYSPDQRITSNETATPENDDSVTEITDSLHICLGTFELRDESVSFVYSYAHPRENHTYTAFYKLGKPILTENNWITDTLEGCEELDIRTAWRTDFDTVKTEVSSLSPDYCIVVGTRDKIPFNKPVLRQINDSICQVLKKGLGLDTIDTTGYAIQVHSGGSSSDKSRYVVCIAAKRDLYIASIIICEESYGQFKTLFRLENNSGKDPEYSTLTSLADLNNDGMADAFLVDFGDFGGKFLIVESNGKWRSWDGFPWGPC